MDGRGGCCMGRYGGGGGGASGGHYDMSKVETIMLRFRPIAPKPTTTGAGGASGGSGGSSSEMSEVTSYRFGGRGRKRRNRSNTNNNTRSRCKYRRMKCNKTNNIKTIRDHDRVVDHGEVVTLPLLPETPTPVDSKSYFPKWLNFGNYNVSTENYDNYYLDNVLSADPTVATAPSFQMIRRGAAVNVTSYVTVVCVTDAFVDVDALGGTDKEKKSRLERDPCPSFLSDPYGRVVWMNQGYREMVGLTNQDDDDRIVVWLIMKDASKVPVSMGLGGCDLRVFTCRVQVQYSHQERSTVGIGLGENNQLRGSNLTVPCDVWRMDGGGLAWRLDIKTALCLGRLN